jgi:hypothetical protein
MTIWQRWRQTAIHNKALVLTSILVAFGTLFYAGAAAFQLWLMNQSNKHTDQQIGTIIGNLNWFAHSMDDSAREAEQNNLELAKNAHDALDAAQVQMRLDERAWVVFRGIGPVPKLGQPWSLSATFTDTGKTPAKDVEWWCTGEVAHDEHSLKWKHPGYENPSLLSPNEQQSCEAHSSGVPKTTQAVLNQLKNPQSNLFFYRSAIYKDVFRQWHWLTFCAELEPDRTNWRTCESGNDTGDGRTPPHPFGD